MKRLFTYVCVSFFLLSCHTIKVSHESINTNNSASIKLLDVCSIPHDYVFNETVVGGLSGIDYNKETGKYYAISDDRSSRNPARFYELSFEFSNGFDVKINQVHYFKTVNGDYYPNVVQNPKSTPDFESIRFYGDDKLLWTTEGERHIVIDPEKNVFINTMVYIGDTLGNTLDSITCPVQFFSSVNDMGIRRNGGFEAMDILEKDDMLVMTSEVGLLQDKTPFTQKDFIRIIFYDIKKRKVIHQFPYQIGEKEYSNEPFSSNGVSELLCIDQDNLLVLERAYSPYWKDNKVKIYQVFLNGATDVKDWDALSDKEFSPVKKQLLLDLTKLNIPLDNLEGLTWGPTLPNGNRTLILMSDNNFQKKQKTQFLLFELNVKPYYIRG